MSIGNDMDQNVTDRILEELATLSSLVREAHNLLHELSSGQELIRRSVVNLGTRVTVLECDSLPPIPRAAGGV